MDMENTTAQPVMTDEERNRYRAKSIVGMGLAIMGLVLCWMGLFVGFPGMISVALCVVGMILSKMPPFAKAAKICGVIGIILSAICSIIGFILAGSLIASWF